VQQARLVAWAGTRRRSTLVALGLAGVGGLALLALLVYSAVELARFDRVEVRRAALVYAAPQPLVAGVHVKIADLGGTLTRLSYTEAPGSPDAPGQFRRDGDAWEIYLRGLPGLSRAQRVRVEVRDDRILRVTRDGVTSAPPPSSPRSSGAPAIGPARTTARCGCATCPSACYRPCWPPRTIASSSTPASTCAGSCARRGST